MLPPANLLASETSPYLLQHRDNPVHWRPWSSAALAEAKHLQRPILLSIGYAACHWCHVMARESFADPQTAAVMNRLFVNIKVDREERPEIDQIHMAALTATGTQGGWPLTMFLTPDAEPFWGGTYFPDRPRHGQPAFVAVLNAVATAWAEKPGEIIASANHLNQHVAQHLSPPHTVNDHTPTKQLVDTAATIESMIDPIHGGLRGAPKFPNAPLMRLLWLNSLKTGNRAQRDAVVNTLKTMLNGGIFDHIGSGLSRYTVDQRWIVPHFEKMLSDNAQLLLLANLAYATTGAQLLRIRIEETCSFLLREMQLEAGGFAASLDADSDGEEGRFYLWTDEQIAAAVGDADQLALFRRVYTLAQPAGWDGAPIVHRLEHPDLLDARSEGVLKTIRLRLLAIRDTTRTRPARDNKVLTDWNGMTIAALAGSSRLLHHPEWLSAAQHAYRFVCESMSGGRLTHSITDVPRPHTALSSDYAAMIDAAIALYQATMDAHYLRQAHIWAKALDDWYIAPEGGHYLTASDAEDVPMRIRGDDDEATPSATAQIVEALARLATLTGHERDCARLQKTVAAARARISRQGHMRAGIVHACGLADSMQKLIMVEPKAQPLFVPVANRIPDPRRVDEVWGDQAPAQADEPVIIDPTRPGAYLCIGTHCLAPVHTAEALEDMLRQTNPTTP